MPAAYSATSIGYMQVSKKFAIKKIQHIRKPHTRPNAALVHSMMPPALSGKAALSSHEMREIGAHQALENELKKQMTSMQKGKCSYSI